MKERNNNQPEGVFLPPAWCGAICRNAMNDVCVEHCAVKRDCSFFDEKPNLKITDLPRFPDTRGKTKEEKFTLVTVYLAKVVDHLQGTENVKQSLNGSKGLQTKSTDKGKAIVEVAAVLEELQVHVASSDAGRPEEE